MKNKENSELQTEANGIVKPKTQGLQRSFSDKKKFALWLFPETLEEVEKFAEDDNCKSKSEFIEKAIKFYIGYLSAEKNTNYLSPMITESVDAVVHGSERRISRMIFKMAVELGKLTHMIAFENNVSDKTLRELHSMCVDEVSKINGVINFDEAVKFQHSE